MPDKTALPNLAFVNIATPTNPKITVVKNSLIGNGAVTLSSGITMTEGGSKPTLEMMLTFRNTTGQYMQCVVPAGGFTSTTVIAGMKRGIEMSGIDLDTENSDLDIDLLEGSELVGAIPAQLFQLLYDWGRGAISSGANNFRVGDLTDSDIKYFFQNADANKPFIMYDASENEIVGSKNGVDTFILGTGAGSITGGDGITVTAGDIDVDLATGSGLEFSSSQLQATESTKGKKALTAGENLTAGNLGYVGKDGQVYKTVRSIATPAQIASETSGASLHRSVEIADDKIAEVYKDGSNNIRVVVTSYAESTPTVGTPVTIDTTTTDISGIAKLDTDKFVVLYSDSNDANKLYATVCTVSGTVPTAGTPVKLYDTNAVTSRSMDVCQLDTDKFLATARDSVLNDPIAVASTVSGTVITAGASQVVEATAMAGVTKCAQITTDVAAIGYDDGTNISYGLLTISGTTITVETTFDLIAGSLDANDSGIVIPDSTRAIVYNVVSGAGYMNMLTVAHEDTATWTSATFDSSSKYLLNIDSTAALNQTIKSMGNGRIGVLNERTVGGTMRFRVFDCLHDGLKEIFSDTIAINPNDRSSSFAALGSAGNKAVIIMSDGGAANAVKHALFFDTSDQFIGVVESTVSAASSADLISKGNATISGITAGIVQFVGDAGAVATTGSRAIGIATTTTNLWLK